MKTFKNTVAENHTDVTNTFFAQGERKPTDFGKWVEVDEMELELSGHEHLFTVAGTRYYGKL